MYSGGRPSTQTFEATDTEANAWNANASSFYSWRLSLGVEPLPLLEWRRETDRSGARVFKVIYKEGSQEKTAEVVAVSPAEARREFSKTAPVIANITRVEEKEDE